jgi:glutamine cyclotransferase
MINHITIIKFNVILLCGLLVQAQESASTSKESVPEYTYFIVGSIPHDHNAFTQGLVYDAGYIYESTGRRGHSTLRKVDIKDGAVLKQSKLADHFFGEGLTIFNNRIIQVTWQQYTGFVYDKESLIKTEEFYYNTEGWGLTHDGRFLIMSDGSEKLYYLHPETYALEKQIAVCENSEPVSNLNELEFVRGQIYANIFGTNRIARIDPLSETISGWIDLSGLYELLEQNYPVDVLNGIAYDAENDRLFVTGKLWPKIFQIKLIQKVK